ncbi:MAG TPA: low temperature requirement protein A [Propionibacteriaceae bacterium]|nr:low temperature requirement protein A [Propionibacteriaceae bacterium]
MTSYEQSRAHRLRVMSGRDPDERHRAATPLELLYDLTFVVAFGVAAEQVAHLLAEGHYASGLTAFGLAIFAICWAWINFSWFASAYDTDDWAFRLATMVQMVGVIILALGLPQVFHSVDEGRPVDNSVTVAGYVVMRVAMLFLWLRAARQDPPRRRACQTYAVTIGVAQIGWVLLLVLADSTIGEFYAWVALLLPIEFAGPLIAERRKGGTPWHAHHIAERYGLLTIITLGEGVIGTVASLGAVVESQGWTLDAALVAVAGTGLTFGLWWMYFTVPSAEVLHVHRERGLSWGYGHMLIFGSIAATGAGLHVAAYYIGHEAHIGATATVLTVAVPLAVYALTLFALYTFLVRAVDPFHIALLAGTAALLVLPIMLATIGAPMAVCLVVLMLAPLVPVIGYETLGYRHMASAVQRTLARGQQAIG